MAKRATAQLKDAKPMWLVTIEDGTAKMRIHQISSQTVTIVSVAHKTKVYGNLEPDVWRVFKSALRSRGLSCARDYDRERAIKLAKRLSFKHCY